MVSGVLRTIGQGVGRYVMPNHPAFQPPSPPPSRFLGMGWKKWALLGGLAVAGGVAMQYGVGARCRPILNKQMRQMSDICNGKASSLNFAMGDWVRQVTAHLESLKLPPGEILEKGQNKEEITPSQSGHISESAIQTAILKNIQESGKSLSDPAVVRDAVYRFLIEYYDEVLTSVRQSFGKMAHAKASLETLNKEIAGRRGEDKNSKEENDKAKGKQKRLNNEIKQYRQSWSVQSQALKMVDSAIRNIEGMNPVPSCVPKLDECNQTFITALEGGKFDPNSIGDVAPKRNQGKKITARSWYQLYKTTQNKPLSTFLSEQASQLGF